MNYNLKALGCMLSLSTLGIGCDVNAQYYNYNPAYKQPIPQWSSPKQTYYTQPRPSYVPPQYTASTYKYHAPAQTVQNSIYYGRFSLGLDYNASFSSFADEDFSIPSAVIGGNTYVAGTRDFRKQHNALSINAGWRIFKYLGLEAFYTHSLDQKKVKYTETYSYNPEFARGEYSLYYKSYGIDLQAYLPSNDVIEFIASIGVGKYDIQAKAKVVAYEDSSHNSLRDNALTFSDEVMGYRIGGGLQFWLSKKLAFRLMGRWTMLDGELVKYMTEVNAGVRYHFN